MGPLPAIGTTSLVFVLIHLSHGVSALARVGPFYLAAGCIYGLLAYLSQSILPSFLLHFLGDLLVFGLRSSVVHLGSPLSRITSVPLLLAAVVAGCVSAIGFVILARLTASKRPPPGSLRRSAPCLDSAGARDHIESQSTTPAEGPRPPVVGAP
jgi:hypothetical protein